MSVFAIVWEMLKYRPLRFAWAALLWSTMHGSPVVFAVLIGQIFDRLTDNAPVVANPWVPVAVFAAIATSRNLVLWVGEYVWIDHWLEQSLQLRRNMLRWLLEAPGSRILGMSTGRAISTFRDDVDDILNYMETYVDGAGFIVFSVGALWVMASIEPVLTVILLIPLVLTLLVTQALVPEIRRRRREMRFATEAVTGYVGDLFSAVQAVKLSGASDSTIAEFDSLNETRRAKALRDTFLTEALRSVNVNMASIAVAITLIFAATEVGSPGFSVGDLTVFLVYLPRLTGHTAWMGDVFAQHRRAGVAFERMKRVTVDAPELAILDRTRMDFSGIRPSVPDHHPVEPFRTLRIESLSYHHPDGKAGLSDICMEVGRGEFVVVTGRIGSGKSLVLRALLGLVPATGEILWNDEVVDDPASFFIPPRSAYTPQVPTLFSDTLARNISFGRPITDPEIGRATQLAVLDEDVDRLEHGLETMVGARGVKLSGGQMQRSAAARMFATESELLVFDDLSSALDVHTEARLWDGIFAKGDDSTSLVVSHRRPALQRADRVYLMDGGRVVGVGSLEELLETSELMQELWSAGVDA